jgi:hypothetical protein
VTSCETEEQGGGYACVLDEDTSNNPVCVERCDVRSSENCVSANSEVYECRLEGSSCLQVFDGDCGKIRDEKSCRTKIANGNGITPTPEDKCSYKNGECYEKGSKCSDYDYDQINSIDNSAACNEHRLIINFYSYVFFCYLFLLLCLLFILFIASKLCFYDDKKCYEKRTECKYYNDEDENGNKIFPTGKECASLFNGIIGKKGKVPGFFFFY